MRKKLLSLLPYSITGFLLVSPLWMIMLTFAFLSSLLSEGDYKMLQIFIAYFGLFVFIFASVFVFSVFLELHRDERINKKSLLYIMFLILCSLSIGFQLLIITFTLGFTTIAIIIALSLAKKANKKTKS
jgi:uncharacterized membrane protein YwaF